MRIRLGRGSKGQGVKDGGRREKVWVRCATIYADTTQANICRSRGRNVSRRKVSQPRVCWPSFVSIRERESFCLPIKSIPDRSLFELLCEWSRLERYSGSSVCKCQEVYCSKYNCAFHVSDVRYSHLDIYHSWLSRRF